jgi:hypothetical protein
VHLDFRGTGLILAAEQDGGFQRVVLCPGIVPIAEGMLETFQHPIQVQAQIAISLDGISGREGLVVEVVVVDRLSTSSVIDFFNFCGGGFVQEESAFIKLSHSEKSIGAGTILRPLEFSAQLEEAFPGGRQ